MYPDTRWTGGSVATRAGLDMGQEEKSLPLSGIEPWPNMNIGWEFIAMYGFLVPAGNVGIVLQNIVQPLPSLSFPVHRR
jgi:hypothetical protein